MVEFEAPVVGESPKDAMARLNRNLIRENDDLRARLGDGDVPAYTITADQDDALDQLWAIRRDASQRGDKVAVERIDALLNEFAAYRNRHRPAETSTYIPGPQMKVPPTLAEARKQRGPAPGTLPAEDDAPLGRFLSRDETWRNRP